jgi:hypothetical protein
MGQVRVILKAAWCTVWTKCGAGLSKCGGEENCYDGCDGGEQAVKVKQGMISNMLRILRGGRTNDVIRPRD